MKSRVFDVLIKRNFLPPEKRIHHGGTERRGEENILGLFLSVSSVSP
jgi:hypothetical protein